MERNGKECCTHKVVQIMRRFLELHSNKVISLLTVIFLVVTVMLCFDERGKDTEGGNFTSSIPILQFFLTLFKKPFFCIANYISMQCVVLRFVRRATCQGRTWPCSCYLAHRPPWTCTWGQQQGRPGAATQSITVFDPQQMLCGRYLLWTGLSRFPRKSSQAHAEC